MSTARCRLWQQADASEEWLNSTNIPSTSSNATTKASILPRPDNQAKASRLAADRG